jgi:poly-gamma-glutamate synthesis protein (capsule biosynthesis protein)
MVTLANNHIMDYGTKGLFDTFKSLQENQISYVGAGDNLFKAAKPYTIEKDGMKIAILNFAENEWSIAEEDKPGATPLDIIDNVNQIKSAKATHDKVICIIHGGHEYYHFPSPRMVKQYRFYVDNGADAVVAHHTHCIGGYELYNNAPIIYSLGNFLFTLPSEMEEWYTGLLAMLKIEKNKPITFDLFPVAQDGKTLRVALLKNEQKEGVINQIKEINATIADKDLMQKKWDAFIINKKDQYLNGLSPINAIENRYFRAGLTRLGVGKMFLSKPYLKLVLNLIRCEAHADLIKTTIKKYLIKNK